MALTKLLLRHGNVAEWLRTFIIHPKDLGLILRCHRVTHNYLELQFQGLDTLF